MCYSAMLKQDAQRLGLKYEIRIGDEHPDFRLEPWSVRVFPHQVFPVVRELHQEREILEMNYSLIPKWSDARKPKFATYNARIETLCDKATWKEPAKRNHCIVPLTSFFESCHDGTHAGNIVEFSSIKEGEVLSAAGIWDEWTCKTTGEKLLSFAIITTKPSPFIERTGHDRSPVFLATDSALEWIKEGNWNCNKAKSFLDEHAVHPALDVKIERALKSSK